MSDDQYAKICNREWGAEGVGLVACDLDPQHDGEHLAMVNGSALTCPDVDAWST